MSKRHDLLKKILMIMTVLFMVIALLPVSAGQILFAEDGEEEEEDGAPEIYTYLTNMADNPPSDWNQTKDPYGYGLNNTFFLNSQQELLALRTYERKEQSIISYDTLMAKNEDYALDGAGSTETYKLPKEYMLSHARTIAFDPTGSGRNDHVAVIGVYAEDYQNDKTLAHIYVYVMDKEKHLSNLLDMGYAQWISDKHSVEEGYNNDYMWDFNSMNFMDITAGDYDGDHKDSLVVWACGSAPVLQQVNVTSSNGIITLNDLAANGYQSVPSKESWSKYKKENGKLIYTEDAHGLTHYLYYDSDDQVVENRLSVVIRTGDFNGDYVDDLAVLSYVGRVTGTGKYNYQNMYGQYYVPMLSYSYGYMGETASITEGKHSETQIAVQKDKESDNGQYHVAPMACGMAVGDIDNDGRDEAVISGIFHEVDGSYWKEIDGLWGRKEVADAYGDVNKKKLVTAIYRGGNCLMFDEDMSANSWTHGGGGANGGYYTDWGNATTADQSLQQISVETVAINGKGSAEHIFISGDLYTYNSGKLTAVYQPNYFQQINSGTGSGLANKETYMRSTAVGNFDGNDEGREQIAIVTAAALDKNGKPFYVAYAMGMMGGVYEDEDGNPQPQAVSYYCTSQNELENKSHYYPSSTGGDCTIMDCLSYSLCAWDNDSDGLHVKYVGKEYTYTDPAVMAIIQAPPYFEEVKGAMTDLSTSYSITTSYEYSTSQGNSVSFGVGADYELEAEVVKFNVSAGYATDWSESFENSWCDSDEYTLVSHGEDQVLLYRTPVTIYKYQVEVDNTWSDKNIIELSFPGKSGIASATVSEYNEFAEYYNKKLKDIADGMNEEAGETVMPEDKIPYMSLINDKYLGHEGNPYGYMWDSSPLDSVTILQETPITSGVGTASMEYGWSREHSTGYEESNSHGFNFEAQLMFQWHATPHTGMALGGHVSLDYMRDFSTSRTEAKGVGASCAIGNLDPEVMEELGMSQTAARQYGFNSQLATWDSNLPLVDSVYETSMESEFDGEFDDEENEKREMKYVPIFGYVLSGVKSATPPVTDLRSEFKLDENEEMNILLTWSDPSDEYRWVGAYEIYQIQKDGSYTLIDTVDADTTEYMFTDIDGRSEYKFVVRTKAGVHDRY